METYSIEKRFVSKDYSRFWGNQNASLMRGPSGEPRYFICVLEDIDERKRGDLVLHSLTSREVEVLRFVANRRTNTEITQEMNFSVSTAKLHVQRIIAKLEVSNRTEAAVRVVELGLVPSGTDSGDAKVSY